MKLLENSYKRLPLSNLQNSGIFGNYIISLDGYESNHDFHCMNNSEKTEKKTSKMIS